MDDGSGDNVDLFHKCFKYYKRNKNVNDNSILDLQTADQSNDFLKYPLNSSTKPFPGLKSMNHWKAYTLYNHPGLILITNLMTTCLEKYLARRCLVDLVKKPNRTNLDAYTKEEDINNLYINSLKPKNNSNLLKKLRWITMGYHHNWDTKEYSEDDRSEMPQDIKKLTDHIAECVGFYDFVAEAGIVNIYHKNSSLAGHVDNSEYNLSSPIISLSLGCTGIFLVGGPDKSSEPTALYVRSGDVVVMSGKARLCYHAVPCIITNSYKYIQNRSIDRFDNQTKEINKKNLSNDEQRDDVLDWNYDDYNFFDKFLNESRININTRQVHKKPSLH